jgi:hypothetical protein
VADQTGNRAGDFADRSKWTTSGDVLTDAEGESLLRRIIGDRAPDLRSPVGLGGAQHQHFADVISPVEGA